MKTVIIDDDQAYAFLFKEKFEHVLDNIILYHEIPTKQHKNINLVFCDLDLNHMTFDNVVQSVVKNFPNAFVVVNSGVVDIYFKEENYESRILAWGADHACTKDSLDIHEVLKIQQKAIDKKGDQ